MIKTISIEISKEFIEALVELNLSDGTHMLIEVWLQIDKRRHIIYPHQFGGCLGAHPIEDDDFHHLFNKDCQGNDIDLLSSLHKQGLISFRPDASEVDITIWDFNSPFEREFEIEQKIMPTEEQIIEMIQQLAEYVIADASAEGTNVATLDDQK